MKEINNQRNGSRVLAILLAMALLFSTVGTAWAAHEDYKHWADKAPAAWQNGALQSSNSQYFEDEVVPHYFYTDGLTVGNTYGFNIYYDYKTGNTCGFDYLAQYNLSRSPTPVGSAPAANAAIGSGPGNFYTVGANITNVGSPITSGIQRYVQVTFTATASVANFYWGMHLAVPGADGGTCAGASGWSGASLQTNVGASPTISGATMVGGGGTMQINPSGIIRGSISGFKWNDINGDGVEQPAATPPEVRLSGWTIQLCSDAACNIVIQSTTTDINGNYTFVKPPGTYYVQEVLQSNWAQTNPPLIKGPYSITVAAPTVTGVNFGNRQANLAVGKTCPAYDDFVNNDPPYWFDITVTNMNSPLPNGNAIIPASLTIQDVLPNGIDFYATGSSVECTSVNDTVTCVNPNALGVGASWTVRIYFTVTDASVQLNISNTASITNSMSVPDPVSNNNQYTCSTTTPVTLAFFQASRSGDLTTFKWTTASEYNTAGFNLYAKTGTGRQKINNKLITSKVISSLTPQEYSFDAVGLEADAFYLEDVNLRGQNRTFGPYKLGEIQGAPIDLLPIDWNAINAEATVNSVQAALAPLETAVNKLFLPLTLRNSSNLGSSASFQSYHMSVNQDGLYRVTYEDLKAVGLDLNGFKLNTLAVYNQGQSIPLTVYSPKSSFAPGAYIEFVGKKLNSLYTNVNVYTLKSDVHNAKRVSTDGTAPSATVPAANYLETVAVDKNKSYSDYSVSGDPWYETMLYADSGPVSYDKTGDLVVDSLAVGAPGATLKVNVWGFSALKETPDHKVDLTLNGQPVGSDTFDGWVNRVIEVALPNGVVQNGANKLSLTLPFDLGMSWDAVVLDTYSLTYPRQFNAANNRLVFTAAGDVFQVNQLPSTNVVVYRVVDGVPVQLTNVQVSGAAGNFSARFAGSASPATYLVWAQEGILKPSLIAPVSNNDLTSGTADYLVISHPNFISSLTPLVNARKADGLTVRVVDVNDVYSRFGDGIVSPQGIKNYIAYAAANMGTKLVLLVGGDSYDYFNYYGIGSKSYIPSPYMAMPDSTTFTPVDPWFADLDNDFVPDLALGRLPVYTASQLQVVIDKILAYQNKNYGQTGVFAADKTFTGDSESFASFLNGWSLEKTYLDAMPVADARTQLINSLNSGVAVANYVGHSGETVWSFDNLLTVSDVNGLTNAGRPAVVLQWGCYNTYSIEPRYQSLGQAFMLNGNKGASAVLGSVLMASAGSEKALGDLLMPKLNNSGATIGAALLQAKQELAANRYGVTDVLMGWTILGDPGMKIVP